jgi:hypothetical protein
MLAAIIIIALSLYSCQIVNRGPLSFTVTFSEGPSTKGENKSFLGRGCQWEGGRHKERGNEGVYGECVLNPYMKIEE